MDEIVRPTVRALAEAGTPFSGVLYAGLMLTAEGPKLIEYNVRFGDPECEAIMPRIEGDFAELLHAVATGRLAERRAAAFADSHAVTVIVAARGYPGTPASGGLIREIEAAEQVRASPSSTPAQRGQETALVAKGGRVLAVTAVADTFANARARAYRAVDQIDFADGFHRKDIGWRELRTRAKERWRANEPALGPLLASLLIGRCRRRRHHRPARHSGARAGRSAYRRCAAGIAVMPRPLAWVWHGPVGAGDRFASVETERFTRQVLVDFEMAPVTAVVERAPLRRSAPGPVRAGRRFPAQRARPDPRRRAGRRRSPLGGYEAAELRATASGGSGTCGAHQLWPWIAVGLLCSSFGRRSNAQWRW